MCIKVFTYTHTGVSYRRHIGYSIAQRVTHSTLIMAFICDFPIAKLNKKIFSCCTCCVLLYVMDDSLHRPGPHCPQRLWELGLGHRFLLLAWCWETSGSSQSFHAVCAVGSAFLNMPAATQDALHRNHIGPFLPTDWGFVRRENSPLFPVKCLFQVPKQSLIYLPQIGRGAEYNQGKQ